MTGKIFVNYRRKDDPGYTLATYLMLEKFFESTDIFMDVEGHINPGEDYVIKLQKQVLRCDVMLVFIGPRWLSITDDQERPRIMEPHDWVRVEIATALSSKKRVIPVLVNDAIMPSKASLPDDLHGLTDLQAARLRPESFKPDAEKLILQVRKLLLEMADLNNASGDHNNTTGDHNNTTGVRNETIEHNKWDYIRSLNDVDLIREHIRRYPSGQTAHYAREKLEEIEWNRLSSNSTIDDLEKFLDDFPVGKYSGSAKAALKKLTEQTETLKQDAFVKLEKDAWDKAVEEGTNASIQNFIHNWPTSKFFRTAKRHLLGRQSFYRSIVTLNVICLLVAYMLNLTGFIGIASMVFAAFCVLGMFGVLRLQSVSHFLSDRLLSDTRRDGMLLVSIVFCPGLLVFVSLLVFGGLHWAGFLLAVGIHCILAAILFTHFTEQYERL